MRFHGTKVRWGLKWLLKSFPFFNETGQIIIFHQPRFPWNKGISLTKPPFGGPGRVWGRYNLTRMKCDLTYPPTKLHKARCSPFLFRNNELRNVPEVTLLESSTAENLWKFRDFQRWWLFEGGKCGNKNFDNRRYPGKKYPLEKHHFIKQGWKKTYHFKAFEKGCWGSQKKNCKK